MRYAQLTPGQGFRPVNSFFYYLQRLVVTPRLRGICVRTLRQWVRLRRGGLARSTTSATASHRALLDALHADGYAELGPLFTTGQCADIQHFLADKLLTGRADGVSGYTITNVPPKARLAEYSLRDIVDSPHILALANDSRLLEMAAGYIGCKPTLSQLGLRWSFPSETVHSNLQAFHRDTEDWRYLKVLVYLTDVGTDDGPHVYVRGTHRTKASIRLRPQGDMEIIKRYGHENLAIATGERGFGFAVDTAGIHKGSRPIGKPRLLLQIQYSLFRSFAYVYEPQPYRGRQPFDRYINRLILADPQ